MSIVILRSLQLEKRLKTPYTFSFLFSSFLSISIEFSGKDVPFSLAICCKTFRHFFVFPFAISHLGDSGKHLHREAAHCVSENRFLINTNVGEPGIFMRVTARNFTNKLVINCLTAFLLSALENSEYNNLLKYFNIFFSFQI
jgi:hypothetical protein